MAHLSATLERIWLALGAAATDSTWLGRRSQVAWQSWFLHDARIFRNLSANLQTVFTHESLSRD